MFRTSHNQFMVSTLTALVFSLLTVGSFFSESLGDDREVDRKVGDPNVLVVCPDRFQPAMVRWIQYREQQGYLIKMLSPAPTSAGVKKQIREVAAGGMLKHVFLVGDSGDRLARNRDLVPTDFVPAKVNVLFGSEPEIATDHTYVDFDDDGIQDLSIGRLPVDSIAEIERFTQRVISYEANQSGDQQWRRRINVVTGVGGFGQVIDGLIEQTTKQIITDLIPAGYATKMTCGSWSSPYCPDPRRFSDSSIERFNEGCLFWVYIGHGNRHCLDKVYLPDQSHDILDSEMAAKLNCRSGNPIAIFLACYTGANDDPNDCLAEIMLRQEKGPIAAICGTRVTMPYALSLLSLEMVHEFFEGEAQTLGQLMLVAKRRMVNGSDNNQEYRDLIEGMGKTFSPLPGLLKQERLEHVQLIHLVGDPLLRLKRPEAIKLRSPEEATQGERLQIEGIVDSPGNVTVELAYRRDRLRYRPPRRKDYDSSEASFAQYQQTYEEAQELVWATQTVKVEKAGAFKTEIIVPSNISGRCVVRAVLDSGSKFAIGSSSIKVNRNSSLRNARSDTSKVRPTR